MFLRALRICSPEFIDEEIDKIYKIGSDLRCPKMFIDKSLKAARRTFYTAVPKEPYTKKNMLVLPYNENFVGISQLLKSFNVNVVFKNNNTEIFLFKILQRTQMVGCTSFLVKYVINVI